MNEFTFEVYSNLRSSNLTYNIKYTDTGWNIRHIAINGDCEPDGKPFFYENFEQDLIDFPSGFGEYLEWLWKQITNTSISNEKIQDKLQELADWVTTCEKNKPFWKGWNK